MTIYRSSTREVKMWDQHLPSRKSRSNRSLSLEISSCGQSRKALACMLEPTQSGMLRHSRSWQGIVCSKERTGGRVALSMLRSVLIALFLSVNKLMIFVIRWFIGSSRLASRMIVIEYLTLSPDRRHRPLSSSSPRGSREYPDGKSRQ